MENAIEAGLIRTELCVRYDRRESVLRLRDASVPASEVGIGLVDKAAVVLPEIELLWRNQGIAVVADVDEAGRVGLERLGWTVLDVLDDAVIAELAGRLALWHGATAHGG